MRINRYTQFTPAQYNPMGLEELMQVPMMKRIQHDQLLQGAAETQAALSQLDYLGVHSDKVGSARQALEDNLKKQVDEISARGITNTSKSDFIRLNAEYQAAMGSQGIFGKAAAAKAELDRVKQEALDTAIQLGHDPAETTKRINEEVAAYEQSQLESDDITNISPIMPPKGQDLQKDIAQAVQIAGKTVRTERGEEGYRIGVDTSTGEPIAYAVTETGQVIHSDNKSALGYQLANLSEKWLREGGEGYRYAQWNGLDMDSIQSQLINGLSSARVSEIRDNRQQNIEFLGGIGSGTGNRADEIENENDNTIYEDIQELANTVVSKQPVSETRNQIAQLRASGSPEDISQARRMEYYLEVMEDQLSNNKEYQQIKRDTDRFIEDLEEKSSLAAQLLRQGYSVLPAETRAVVADRDSFNIIDNVSGEVLGTIPSSEINYFQNQSHYNEFTDAHKKRAEIEDEAIKNQTINYVGYVIDPRVAKAGEWKTYVNTVADLMASSGEVGNKYKVDSFIVDGKRRDIQDSATHTELFRLLGEGSDRKITRFYVDGQSNEPMIEFTFSLPEGGEIKDGKWNNIDIDENGKIVMRASIGEFQAEAGDPISNLYIKALEDYGGKKGSLLAEAIRHSSKFKHISASGNPFDYSQSEEILDAATYLRKKGAENANLYRDPKTGKFQFVVSNYVLDNRNSAPKVLKDATLEWRHMITPDMLDDPETLNQLPPKLVEGFSTEFVKYNQAGLSMEDILELDDAELDLRLKEFLKEYGDQPIQFNSKEAALLMFSE